MYMYNSWSKDLIIYSKLIEYRLLKKCINKFFVYYFIKIFSIWFLEFIKIVFLLVLLL